MYAKQCNIKAQCFSRKLDHSRLNDRQFACKICSEIIVPGLLNEYR